VIATFPRGRVQLRSTSRGSRYIEITAMERGKPPLKRVCDTRTKGWKTIRAAIGNPSWLLQT